LEDDPLRMLYLEFMARKTWGHTNDLQVWLYHHQFNGTIQQEREFFEDKKWTAEELQSAVQYAVQVANHYSDEHRQMLIDWMDMTDDEIELVDLDYFITADDAKVDGVIVPDDLTRMELAEIDTERQMPSTIALLGIIRGMDKESEEILLGSLPPRARTIETLPTTLHPSRYQLGGLLCSTQARQAISTLRIVVERCRERWSCRSRAGNRLLHSRGDRDFQEA